MQIFLVALIFAGVFYLVVNAALMSPFLAVLGVMWAFVWIQNKVSNAEKR